jgi:hypothetical protein
MSESEKGRRQREGQEEAIRTADRHMERVDIWAEGLSGIEDHAERQVRLRGMARHAELAAQAYAEARYPWGRALAEVARGYALVGLAGEAPGEGRAELFQEAIAACGQALEQADGAEHVRLGEAAALLMACGEVLAQTHALQEDNPAVRQMLEAQMAMLGEGTGEALLWESILHQEGQDRVWMAQIAEAVADLEPDPQAKLDAAASFHALAQEAATSLWQTVDTESSDEAITLLRKARAALRSAQDALPAARQLQPCPHCGTANDIDRSYCTSCGASLRVPQETLLAPAALAECLVIVDGPGAGQRCALRDGLCIGRGEDNDLVLRASLVSRHHARIRGGKAGYEIVDLGSSNGTQVNRVPIRGPTPLADGDVIEAGGVVLQVELNVARSCPSCGAALRPGLAFCTRCGARAA